MPHPIALFALSLMECQRRLKIFRFKNIDNVFELSGVAFRLALPCGRLLVRLFRAIELKICTCILGDARKSILF